MPKNRSASPSENPAIRTASSQALILSAAVHLRFGLPASLPLMVKKAIKLADKVSAWLEAVQIAGFTEAEADKLFGRPETAVLRGLEIKLRPPAVVRADYVARHAVLLAACT